MSMRQGAHRLAGYVKPNLWTKLAALAGQQQPINLGQGFPSWNPPEFFYDAMDFANRNTTQQYTRAYGHPSLVNTLADFYSPVFNRKLDPMTNICVSNGGVTSLNAIFMGLVNPGDEVIIIDPSYDCYPPSIQIAGGITRSVPLRPKKMQTTTDIKNKKDRYKVTEDDMWEIDYDLLERTINEKTKCILINSPHNPTGKVFTMAEYENIAKILKKHENIFVIEDEVYEHITFDNYEPFNHPRMSNVEGMFDRCISVSSAGKIFGATGIRVGWLIGPADLIRYCQSFQQYNIFCMHAPTQAAIGICMEQALKNGFFTEINERMMKRRNLLIDGLVEGSQEFNMWIPQGGFFTLCDISNLPVKKEYYTSELFSDQPKITKDIAYILQSTHERGVMPVPCSFFYQKELKELGENQIRFAFCKDPETLEAAGKCFKKEL